MASLSLQQLRIVEDMLKQILDSIHKLELWNEPYSDVNEMLSSPDGVKTLAADCMLIEAIGEGFKRIDERTKQQLLPTRPEIPWNAVKGMRNHIAHGYFDINEEYVFSVIKNDLAPLLEAVEYLLKITDELYLTV
jgi:uncharacterized protein with HEPN domain